MCQLTRLEAFDLHGNKLTTLPAELNQLEQLKELNVSGNIFASWPHVITNLRKLHSLDISRNQLKLVIASLASMPKLRTLLLQGNSIRLLPADLRSIEHLNISDNKLVNFSVAHMKRLRHLNASRNRLEHLPLGVYNLAELHTLRLNSNKIEYVSQDIILLKRLRVLDLSNNRLTCLPSVIHELENLHSFNVKGNKIDGNFAVQSQHAPPERAMTQEQNVGGTSVLDINSNVHRSAPDAPVASTRKNRPRRRLFPFSIRRKKNATTSYAYAAHSRNIATQYTPKSSVKTRGRPPLNFQPHAATNQPTSFTGGAPSGFNNTVYKAATEATTNHDKKTSVKTQWPNKQVGPRWVWCVSFSIMQILDLVTCRIWIWAHSQGLTLTFSVRGVAPLIFKI